MVTKLNIKLMLGMFQNRTSFVKQVSYRVDFTLITWVINAPHKFMLMNSFHLQKCMYIYSTE